MKFFKYQACGNDYVYIDCFEQIVENPEDLAKKISNRNFGVGSDGLILILPSKIADAKMRIFNSDGSEAKMCGNGIRCVGKYLSDEKENLKEKNILKIETISGVKNLEILEKSEKISKIKVDMGSPKLINYLSMDFLKNVTDKRIAYVSVGNPHCVVFCKEINLLDVNSLGSRIQNLDEFEDGVNVEFVKINSRNDVDIRIFERGSGETLACGTGACASVFASVLENFCDGKVNVNLRGGNLLIEYIYGNVYMTGESIKVFEGEYYV